MIKNVLVHQLNIGITKANSPIGIPVQVCKKITLFIYTTEFVSLHLIVKDFELKWQPNIATTFHFDSALFAFKCFASGQFFLTAIAGDREIFRIARHFQLPRLIWLWLKIDRYHSLEQTMNQDVRPVH